MKVLPSVIVAAAACKGETSLSSVCTTCWLMRRAASPTGQSPLIRVYPRRDDCSPPNLQSCRATIGTLILLSSSFKSSKLFFIPLIFQEPTDITCLEFMKVCLDMLTTLFLSQKMKKDLQQLLNIVESKSKEKGLELNSKKTEVMVISRKEEPPLINITINGIKLKQRDHFKYLGALISSDGRNNTEISARIAQAKMTFQKMKTALTNSHISIHTRKRTLECYIEPILMYGCEAWTISKQALKKLEAVEMWFLRRMMKISWMAKKSNDTVLKEAHTSRALVNKIRTRQTTFFGHVMRREK